ncbi:hypothetical protein [Burkholderia gladioli]|uniref:hypothetical protein n=1 Tax=Burkholderia gladioli TaxID=28095 RepID=UPI00163FAAA2|nr:hypothetical protein [Burkholderia gladioli]
MMGNRERDAKVCKQLSFLGDELPVFLASWEGSAVIFLSIFMALFLPADVLSRGGPLSDFVGWMSRFFPLIEGYGRLSKYPEVTKVYFSIMLVVSPILIRHFVKERMQYMKGRIEMRKNNPSKFLRTGFLLNLFCIVVFYLWIFKNDGLYYSVMPVVDGRFSLAIYGLVYAGGAIWFLVSTPVSEVLIFLEGKPEIIRG